MRYWIKVILEDSFSCESCGRALLRGDVAFVFKDDLAKDKRSKCPICMQREFVMTGESLKL